MSKKANKKPIVDPFSEMKAYEKRIPGQHEANLKRERELEEKKQYMLHVKQGRRDLLASITSEENAMPSSKAAKYCLFTAAGALVLAAAILLLLFNIRFYLPSTQDEFISNFNRISTVDSYAYLFETYPQTAEYSISALDKLPDESSPLYFSDGNFYLYFDTNGKKISSITAGAVDSYTGFDKTAGAFTSIEAEVEYKAFLMRIFAGMDSRFITDYELCSDIIDRMQTHSAYENYTYTHEDDYTFTFDFTTSLYIHIEPVRAAVAVWPESEAV